MRELVSFIAAAAMVASVASCGPAEDETKAGQDQAAVAETSSAVEEVAAVAAEVVEAAEVAEEVAEEVVEEVVEEVAESVEEIIEPEIEPIEPIEEVVEVRATSGDAEEGQVVYTLKCGGCHAVEVGVTRMGPTMVGLYGRKSGMAGVDVTWDEASLDAFLAAPKDFAANIMMTPLADAKQRLDVIAYLETLK